MNMQQLDMIRRSNVANAWNTNLVCIRAIYYDRHADDNVAMMTNTTFQSQTSTE